MHPFTQVTAEMGNLFCGDNKDIQVLDSRDLADPAIINTVRQMEKLGHEQHDPLSMRDLSTRQSPSLTQSRETTSLSSADLQSERSREHSCRCPLRRTTAPCSPSCSLHPRYVMETSMSSSCMRTKHVPQHSHTWAQRDLEQSLIWLPA